MLRNKLIQECSGFLLIKSEGKKIKLNYTLNSGLENEYIRIEPQQYEAFDHTRIQVKIKPKKDITILKNYLKSTFKYYPDDQIFINGYQSWSHSKRFKVNEKIKPAFPLLKKWLWPYGDYQIIKDSGIKANLHSWNYSYILPQNEIVLFLASANESKGFTSFHFNTAQKEFYVHKAVNNQEIKTSFFLYDLFFFDGTLDEAHRMYFDLLELKQNRKEKIAGYTTWYYRFNKIVAEDVYTQIASFKKNEIPIEHFQIDDGWQKNVGDWLEIKTNFGGEMDALAHHIHQEGWKAGLWLAPFVCEKKSDVFKHKKDWLLKNKAGKSAVAGYSPMWSGWFYAMDFYNEEFREYLASVMKTVFKTWGFDWVKLDFLYAACLHPPKGKSSAEVMREIMLWLNEHCGSENILACGIPFYSAIENTGMCRIGPDTHTAWDHWVKHLNNHERLSTNNAIDNTIARYRWDGVGFKNDPDVVLLRKDKNELSEEEQITLLYINYIFGSVFFISDDIDAYDEEAMQLYKSCFPLKSFTIKKVQRFEHHLNAVFESGMNEYQLFYNFSETSVNIQTERSEAYDCVQKSMINCSSFALSPHSIKCLLKLSAHQSTKIKDPEHLIPGM